MKTKNLIASILMSAMTLNAWAVPDRGYYVTELVTQQKFDVYNDGRNTYLESIPGLVVTGATADGEFYIVKGVPNQIRGFMNGKPITFLRGVPLAPKAAARPDAAAVGAELQRLTEELSALTKAAEGKRPAAPATTATTTATTTAPAIAAAASAPAPAPAAAAPVAAPDSAKPVQSEAATAAGAGRPAEAKRAPPRLAVTDTAAWRVTPNDGNLRLVVERWSAMVGWTAIWDVDRDIPIGTGDRQSNDFKSAVRRLLASTEFGDVQVKPCFYSNEVIRVVRKTTKCNPTE